MLNSCIVCGSTKVEQLISIQDTPVHCNILWQTRNEALNAPKGEIRLATCTNCGHIYNQEFRSDLTEYNEAYDNSLHFSPTFQNYAQDLAHQLVEKYNLREKEIIEIGSGQGEFLSLLCDYGNNHGIGFDPSYIPDSNSESHSKKFKIIPDYYSADYLNYEADLISTRHLLEHIDQPRKFLNLIAQAAQKSAEALLYIEVPNAMYVFQEMSIWDIIYEHPSYFSKNSLAYLLDICGFEIVDLETAFGGQFLYSVTKYPNKASHLSVGFRGSLPDLEAFQSNYEALIQKWHESLVENLNLEKKIVPWGAGSKGVTFLNLFKQLNVFEYMVDINPRKWGKFIPGTGQLVVSPDFLCEYQPDLILIMNPIYEQEIETMLKGLNLNPALSVVH
jgi:2-polyprenyl-3-methyl-5-hydroxy-6-metoxy-1,4-benzoquinol methylase